MRGQDWLAVLALMALMGSLYASTLCPTVYWYDSAEFSTAAWVLGIPHPPGYPLYILIAHLLTYLPGEAALNVNRLSAVSGALLVALTYMVLRGMGSGRGGAVGGALFVSTSPLLWSQCVIAEAYVPGLVMMMLVWLCLVTGHRRHRAGWVVLAAGVAGLGLGVHLFIATCGLGFALMVVLFRQTPGVRRWAHTLQLGIACMVAIVAGSLVFLWIPLRARMNPPLNFGAVTSLDKLGWMVSGGPYRANFIVLPDRLERGWSVGIMIIDQLAVVGVVFAVLGLFASLRRRSPWGLALGLAALGNAGFFFSYYVHDAEVFFLPTLVSLACLAGLGIDAMVRRGRGWALVGLLLLGVVVVAQTGRSLLESDRGTTTDAHDWAELACEHLPPNAVVMHFRFPREWKFNAVLQYEQMVHGRRPDVTIVEGHPSTQAIARQLHAGRRLFVYVPITTVAQAFRLQQTQAGLFEVRLPR